MLQAHMAEDGKTEAYVLKIRAVATWSSNGMTSNNGKTALRTKARRAAALTDRTSVTEMVSMKYHLTLANSGLACRNSR
jgi:hypothetical protein